MPAKQPKRRRETVVARPSDRQSGGLTIALAVGSTRPSGAEAQVDDGLRKLRSSLRLCIRRA